MDFILLFLFFWLISICGWIMEVIVCSLEERRFINRGFLIGPYCPIYGFGGLILLLLTPFKDNLILVFLLSLILCSILEYFVSYLMELLFKVRWWDYSQEAFNINGRICLRNALAFGILGMFFVCYINPFIFKILNNIADKRLIIFGLVTFAVTVCDLVISLNIMSNIKGTIKAISDNERLKDATNDIKELIREKLLEKSFLYRRLIKTYNQFEYYRSEIVAKINKLKDEHDNNLNILRLKKAHHLLFFIISGIISTLVLILLIKDFGYGFMMGFGICIIIGSLYDRIRKK